MGKRVGKLFGDRFSPMVAVIESRGNGRNITLTNQEKYEIITQIGQDRVRNICSICHKKMDIKNYHIQLCKSCRNEALEFIQKKTISQMENNIKREMIALQRLKEVKLYKKQKKSKIIEFLKDPASSPIQNLANAGAI